MSHKALEYHISGIKCDGSGCDFRDYTVALANYPAWLNRPCPKCGANLLTQTDLDTTNSLIEGAEAINKLLGPVKGDKPANVIPIKIEMDGSGISNISFPRAPKSEDA